MSPRHLALLAAIAAAGAAAGATESAEGFGRVVTLPPLIVTGNQSSRAWEFLEVPGLQVLSRVPEATARSFVDEYQRTQQLLTLILPAEMQVRHSSPQLIVLNDQVESSAMEKQLLEDPRAVTSPLARTRETADTAAVTRDQFLRLGVKFLSNLGLEDADASIIYVLVDPKASRITPLKPTYGSLRYLMAGRTPALPEWLQIAVETLNEISIYNRDRIVLNPAGWISRLEQAGLRTNPEFPRNLLATADILEGPPPAASDTSDRALRWRAQATLFARWALVESRDPDRRAQFWRYVDRVSAEAPTEEVFRACFGFGYADLRDFLSDFLPLSAQAPMSTPRAPSLPPAAPRFRLATVGEIARIAGEWGRLEVKFVSQQYPEFAARYKEHVARSLDDFARQGITDQGFLDAVALERCDAGDDQAAESLLAVAARDTRRPRVHLELARVRYNRAVATGRLGASDAAAILDSLHRARALAPPLAAVYALGAEVLIRMEGPPRPVDLELLAEGAARYPKDPVLRSRLARAQEALKKP